jgi:hypothetical protein
MSETCKDGTDLILRNSNSLTGQRFSSIENTEDFFLEGDTFLTEEEILPFVNATDYDSNNGLVNRGMLSNIFRDFEESVVAGTPSSLDRSISLFGKEALDNSIKQTNLFILKKLKPVDFGLPVTSGVNFDQYPSLKDRISKGTSITSLEVSEFIELNYLTPNLLSRSFEQNPEKILRQLDNFYKSSFTNTTMGSFCALAPSIFGAVAGFFTAVVGAAALIENVIGQIANFSLASLINNLQKQIIRVVDSVIENVKNIVENFSVSGLIESIATFVDSSVLTQALIIKEQVMSFFSEENIRDLKERINNLIGYAINLFTNPTLEEIQFLVYRFCSFISQVENQILGVKKPLDDYSSNFEESYKKVSTSSNINTAKAVRSGAIRYEPEVRRRNTNEIQAATSAPRTTNPAPISSRDVDGVTSWNNGRGDSRIRFGGGLQPGRMGEEGWTRVSPEARIYLMRVQTKFGRQLQVNSGYRSPEYNSRIGGATRSKHMDGTAMDITWSGYNEETRRRFIEIAQEEGFLGIGVYNSFTHIDLGPRRRWSG